MKYYSEITKEVYDTEEALKKAEQHIENQVEKKENAVVNERKEAAKVVEKAFADAAAKRKENSAKREELDKKNREIDRKYEAEFSKLERAQREEQDALGDEYALLDKSDKQCVEQAYEELRKFCKKYGAYHYSVDAAGADLFPMLMGFGQMEKAQSMFSNMFNSIFNLF